MRLRHLLMCSPVLLTLTLGCGSGQTYQEQILPPGETKESINKKFKKDKLKTTMDPDAVAPRP